MAYPSQSYPPTGPWVRVNTGTTLIVSGLIHFTSVHSPYLHQSRLWVISTTGAKLTGGTYSNTERDTTFTHSQVGRALISYRYRTDLHPVQVSRKTNKLG